MDLKRWLRSNWDRVGAWAFVVLGAVVLLVGWDRISSTGYPAEQLPYVLSAGIGGALLVAFGATLLLSADLRDEWHKLDRLENTFERIEARLAEQGHAPADAAGPTSGSTARPAPTDGDAKPATPADADAAPGPPGGGAQSGNGSSSSATAHR